MLIDFVFSNWGFNKVSHNIWVFDKTKYIKFCKDDVVIVDGDNKYRILIKDFVNCLKTNMYASYEEVMYTMFGDNSLKDLASKATITATCIRNDADRINSGISAVISESNPTVISIRYFDELVCSVSFAEDGVFVAYDNAIYDNEKEAVFTIGGSYILPTDYNYEDLIGILKECYDTFKIYYDIKLSL